MSLEGKTAVITGGDQAASVLPLRLYAPRARGERRARLAKGDDSDLEGASCSCLSTSGDQVGLKDFCDETASRFGGIDIVVANAGVGAYGPFLELSLVFIDEMIDVNLKGTRAEECVGRRRVGVREEETFRPTLFGPRDQVLRPAPRWTMGRRARRRGERKLFEVLRRDRPRTELLELQPVDQERLAGPEARQRTVGTGRARLGLGMRMEHRELVAVVLGKPHLGVDLELVAVRRGEPVLAPQVPLRGAVAEEDHAAALVRCLLGGVRVQFGANRGGNYHQSVLSIDCSTLSELQKSRGQVLPPAVGEYRDDDRAFREFAGDLAGDMNDRSADTPAKIPSRSRRGDARRRRTRRSRRGSSGRAWTRRGSVGHSRPRASGGPSPDDLPASARRRRGYSTFRERLAHPRAVSHQRPAEVPSPATKARQHRGRSRTISAPVPLVASCARGSIRSRTGRASCTPDSPPRAPGRRAPRRSSPRSQASR